MRSLLISMLVRCYRPGASACIAALYMAELGSGLPVLEHPLTSSQALHSVGVMGGTFSRLGLCAVACLAGALFVGAGAAGAAPFAPYSAVSVGSWPEAVAIGDVTGDGRPDVVMTTGYAGDAENDFRLWVFAQAPDGSLAAPVSYPTAGSYGRGPESVAVGDITGDGRADVVVGLPGLGVQLFPQLAAGSLGFPSVTSTPDAGKIRVGQLDGDGRVDVAGVGWGTNTVSVLLNDGAGGLRAPVSFVARHAGYEDLEVGDVTGDGRADLVVMSGQSYAVPNFSVLPQLAAGGFGTAAEYRVGTNVNTQGIGLGDVTGDGRLDVLASYGGNRPSSFIGVFAQTTAGSLAPQVAYPSYDIPEPVESADVDRDGRVDVVTLHGGWNRAGVYLQQGNGTLAAEELATIPYASHYNPHGLAVGDVDGNGSPDVVLADYNNGLVVLRGTAPPPPPPPPTADLATDVAAVAASVKQRQAFGFDVTATNAGPSAVTATLVVTLSGPAASVGANAAGCSVAGLRVSCTLGSIAAGTSRVVRVGGTAAKKGTIVATATVAGNVTDPAGANNTDSASIKVG